MARSGRRAMSGFAKAGAVLGLASFLLTGSAGARAEDGGVDSQPWIGKAAPEFKLETIAGDALGLSDMRGRWLVVHFGTSW